MCKICVKSHYNSTDTVRILQLNNLSQSLWNSHMRSGFILEVIDENRPKWQLKTWNCNFLRHQIYRSYNLFAHQLYNKPKICIVKEIQLWQPTICRVWKKFDPNLDHEYLKSLMHLDFLMYRLSLKSYLKNFS